MTKNYENNDEKTPSTNVPNTMPQPTNNLPQSPQDQILEFINTLGEHVMDEVMGGTSPHPEKSGEEGLRAGGNPPPDYSFTTEKPAEKAGESRTFAHRGDAEETAGPSPSSAAGSASTSSASAERNNRTDQQSQGQSQAQWGPWGGNWRDRNQNPWAAMASMFGAGIPVTDFDPANHPSFHGGPPGAFPFGGRGRGGHCGPPGGRGGHYGGPWGWKSRRHWGNRGGSDDQDFSPAVDIFDTPDAFVVHIALPGAIKEDIGINYDFDRSELQVSGVVHRPGNEEFLKHLVDGERRVGAFDRKIKLESKGKTVAVDADAITAKLDNGLLEVTVPKLRKADEPEKRKIRIE